MPGPLTLFVSAAINRVPVARGKAMTTATSAASAQAVNADTAPILSLNNIEVVYDRVILVLKGVSLAVPIGGIVALLGANGAGKTTTLKAISNLLHSERGEVTKGSIVFNGAEVHSLSPNEMVRRGCIQVMQGRTTSLGESACTSAPSNTIEPLVTSPRSE